MACSQEELQIEIKKAGVSLLYQPPNSVDDLVKLLDQLEGYLSQVDQSPSESMQTALAPCLKAFVATQLMHHSDDDIRVSAASCISQITRITAPDAPYDDNQMKVIFQLIVSSFDKLSDKSSRAFIKRTAILETVAKVRSCVLMLDLECDALIIQMLHNFLKEIRDYHPDNVYLFMETIMTTVLEESEDISLELLLPILAAVKRNNKEIMPIARRMAEKVLQNCAAKIRPCLTQSVKSSDISLDDYSLIVANICEETPNIGEKNGLEASDEHLIAKETAAEAVYLEEADHAAGSSPKSIMSNVVAQPQDENAVLDSNTLKITEQSDDIRQSKSIAEPSREHDSPGAKDIVESEVKPQKTTKRRGRKRNSSTNVTKPSKEISAEPSLVDVTEPVDSSTTIGEKELEKPIEKRQSKEICSFSYKDPSFEAVEPLESKVENAIQNDSANVASPSPSGNLRDKSHPRKPGRTKKILIQEPTLPADTASKKHSEGSIDSEVKTHEQSGKRAPGGTLNEDRRAANIDNSKENSTAIDPEIKSLKEVRKAVDTSYITEHESSKRKKKAKGFGSVRVSREEDMPKLSVKDVDKETFESKDNSATTPKTNSKRGRTPGKATVYIKKEIGENLVGKKIKVWWPQDQKFYEGIIDSWDPEKKRHRVLYTDGDEEVLYLRTQRWKLVEGDPVSDMEQGTASSSPEEPSQMHQNKKAKMISDSSIKQEKMEATPKSGGLSSDKSKGTATKSGHKSKNVSKDVKSKDNLSQSIDESEDGNKTKPIDDLFKSDVKSKNVRANTPKISKKLEHNGSTAKVKSKSLQRSSKPISNGTGKVKSASSKVREMEDVKEKSLKSDNKTCSNDTSKVKPVSSKVKESEDIDGQSPNSSEAPLSRKRMTPDSPKAQGSSKIKTGKKAKKRG